MADSSESLHVLVLTGGPDREREVSIASGREVARALQNAGHQVTLADITPDQTEALDNACDVIFPALHGKFGEGALPHLLDRSGIPYVGSGTRASQIAIDKAATKKLARQHDVPTPDYELVGAAAAITIEPPLVLKALTEGSSFGMAICHTAEQLEAARGDLHGAFAILMVERFVAGREITVGIVDDRPLPMIEIVPTTDYYDFDAKYIRDDTQYRFDIDLPEAVREAINQHAVVMHQALGCRHLSRVDFILDEQMAPWFLEVNTMPGMTTHSLLPKAAAETGMNMSVLCDKLVRLAFEPSAGR